MWAEHGSRAHRHARELGVVFEEGLEGDTGGHLGPALDLHLRVLLRLYGLRHSNAQRDSACMHSGERTCRMAL